MQQNASLWLAVFAAMVWLPLYRDLYETPFGLAPSVYRIFMVSLMVPIVGSVLTGNTLWYRRFAWWLCIAAVFGTMIATTRYIHPS